MNKQDIINKLHQIENEHDVKILLAVESGSRAWGFESPDSDWDVRFIYVHPLEWYMTVFPGRDVIEVMDGDFDASGWDLRKALQLYRKSNPSILEWLHSPIRYLDNGVLSSKMIELEPTYFNFTSAIYHYFNMADSHNEKYLIKNGITLKRFLYYLRSLLACEWIKERLTPPPVPFRTLVGYVVKEHDIRMIIEKLLLKKSQSKEHDKDEVDRDLCDYANNLALEVKYFLETNIPKNPTRDRDDDLDRLLFEMVTT